MKLEDIQDDTTIRAALRREYAEEYPAGCADFTEDEYVEQNTADVMRRAGAL